MIQFLMSLEGTEYENLQDIPTAGFKHWSKMIVQTSRGDVQGKKEYQHPM